MTSTAKIFMKNIHRKSKLNRMTERMQRNVKNVKEYKIVLKNENEYERMKNTTNE